MTIKELEQAFAAYTGPFADGLRDVFADWRAMREYIEDTAKQHGKIVARTILIELKVKP